MGLFFIKFFLVPWFSALVCAALVWWRNFGIQQVLAWFKGKPAIIDRPVCNIYPWQYNCNKGHRKHERIFPPDFKLTTNYNILWAKIWMVLISLKTLLMPFSIGKIPHTPQTYFFHSFFLLQIFSECPLRLIQYSICDVRLPFACLSVCAIVENLLPGGLERSGQRGYR